MAWDRYIKLGQRGNSLVYKETEVATGRVTPAFETDGIVSFGGAVIFVPGTTITMNTETAWEWVAYYDDNNYIRRAFNQSHLGDWVIQYVIGGNTLAELTMDGLEIAGIFSEVTYGTNDYSTPRDSKHGEVEFDEATNEWKMYCPESDSNDANWERVSVLDSTGNWYVSLITEVGARYRSTDSPIFVGVPYGYDPLYSSVDFTADMNHTAMRLTRRDIAGYTNAEMKVKGVSEGVSF
jgi:hypothetical protein